MQFVNYSLTKQVKTTFNSVKGAGQHFEMMILFLIIYRKQDRNGNN